MPKNIIIVALAALLAIMSALAIVGAQGSTGVNVRVWERVDDPTRNYVSARIDGGSWRTLGTIPIPLTDGQTSDGVYRFGDISLSVALPEYPVAPGSVAREDHEALKARLADAEHRLLLAECGQAQREGWWRAMWDHANGRADLIGQAASDHLFPLLGVAQEGPATPLIGPYIDAVAAGMAALEDAHGEAMRALQPAYDACVTGR